MLTFLSLLVPSTETSCPVVGSMMAIPFLSRVRVEVMWGAVDSWRERAQVSEEQAALHFGRLREVSQD